MDCSYMRGKGLLLTSLGLGTGLEVEAITVLPVCFRPNELEFEQRKQRVNPISELSKG
jgi:hypothetical protein